MLVARVGQEKQIKIYYGLNMGKLTQRQIDTLKRHSVHHTTKHMTEMRKLMKSGKTFKESHKLAMKKVGK